MVLGLYYITKGKKSTAEEKVKGAPTFDKLWIEIEPYFRNLIFAHNATFDMTVLWSMLDRYNIDIPFCLFGCTIAMSRRTWFNEPSYSLQNLCSKLKIQYGNHDAGEDAKSCAEIALKILSEKNISATKTPVHTENIGKKKKIILLFILIQQ